MATVLQNNPPKTPAVNVPEWLRALHVIDVDAHYSEPWDLWTRHAPKGFEKRLPHVTKVKGKDQWMFDGVSLGPPRAVSVLLPDGSKIPGLRFLDLRPDQVHL